MIWKIYTGIQAVSSKISIQFLISARPEELPIKRGGGERYRYTMPKPILNSINKGKWTSLVNSKSLSSALLQEECFISQWLSYSLGIQTKIRPGQIVMNKPIDENTFLNALYDMIENFIACPACGSPETTFEHRNDGVTLHCSTCGFMNAIRPSKSEAIAKKLITLRHKDSLNLASMIRLVTCLVERILTSMNLKNYQHKL